MSYLCTGHQKAPYSDIDPIVHGRGSTAAGVTYRVSASNVSEVCSHLSRDGWREGGCETETLICSVISQTASV